MPEEVTQGGLAASSYAERTEHAEISSVHGKKVFNVDSSGNLVNPATSDNQTNGSQITQIKESAPTDTSQNNPSLVLTRNGLGYVTQIEMTIGTTTYTKTITRDGSNYIQSISSWSE